MWGGFSPWSTVHGSSSSSYRVLWFRGPSEKRSMIVLSAATSVQDTNLIRPVRHPLLPLTTFTVLRLFFFSRNRSTRPPYRFWATLTAILYKVHWLKISPFDASRLLQLFLSILFFFLFNSIRCGKAPLAGRDTALKVRHDLAQSLLFLFSLSFCFISHFSHLPFSFLVHLHSKFFFLTGASATTGSIALVVVSSSVTFVFSTKTFFLVVDPCHLAAVENLVKRGNFCGRLISCTPGAPRGINSTFPLRMFSNMADCGRTKTFETMELDLVFVSSL